MSELSDEQAAAFLRNTEAAHRERDLIAAEKRLCEAARRFALSHEGDDLIDLQIAATSYQKTYGPEKPA